MYGNDYQYANSRLAGSIVRDELDNPVLVFEVGPDGRASVSDIRRGEPKVVPLEDLNVRPIPLGYVNLNNSSHYLTRVPKRRDWRQGVRENNVIFLDSDVRDYNFKAVIRNLFKRKPSFEIAYNRIVKTGWRSCCWHRHWKLERRPSSTHNLKLCYKGNVVGVIDKSKNYSLKKNYDYLKEYLEECL